MIEFTRINTLHPLYPKVEELMNTSFPQEERRDCDVQRNLVNNDPLFHCLSISYKESESEDNGEFIGLLTYWELDGFIYLEHLATKAECRNQGFGHQILDKLKEQSPLPFVLEVEKPTDEFSRRRIGFYERNGLVYCSHEYFQPPYREGDSKTPLNLMFYPNQGDSSWHCPNLGEHYNGVVKEIHTKAYKFFE